MATTEAPKSTYLVHSLHHVNVPVSDRAQTEEWYGKVLGMRAAERPSNPNYVAPNPRGLYLQSERGNFDLHFNVVGPGDERIAAAASNIHFAFEVDDWEGFLARLDELGIEHSYRSDTANVRNEGFAKKQITTSLRDPDGYLVEIMYHYGRQW